MKIMRAIHVPRRLAYVFTIALSALLTFATGREVFAATEWNHLWQYSTFSVTTTSAGSMATYMTNAKNNYDSGTDLNVGASGPIAGYEGNYGNVYWQGLTQPFNASSQSCIIWPTALTNGNCNKTTQKAVSANIYFNTYYTYSDRNWLARHEMGHVFGLNHGSCAPATPTVMNTPPCATLPTTLQSDEINWINTKY